MSMEVPVLEGDEVRSLSQEELGQGERRHHAHAAEDDEPDIKVKILQARMNMFRYQLSQVTLLMEVMIGL